MSAAQNQMDSAADRKWQCIVCGNFVNAERHEREIEATMPRMPNRHYHKDPIGQKIVEVWYTPASRYWHDNGALCGPDCAVALTRAAPIQPTASEIKP